MKKNKFTSKGFTLIELIIVVAIFGIIMTGAMMLIDPVSKIMKKSSTTESTSSAVDNMKRTIDGSLRYARYVDVYTDGFYNAPIPSTAVTAQNELDAVKQFCSTYLDGIYAYSGGVPRLAEGQIRVLTIDNRFDEADPTIGRGRIYESIYNYTSTESRAGVDTTVPGYTLNPANASASSYMNQLIVNPVYFPNSTGNNTGFYVSLGSGKSEYIQDADADTILGAESGYVSGYRNKYGKVTIGDVSSFGKDNFCFTITNYTDSKWEVSNETYVKGPFASSVSALGLININSAESIFQNFASGTVMTDPFYVHEFDSMGNYISASEFSPHSASKSFRVFDTGNYGSFSDEYPSLTGEYNASKNDVIVIIYALTEEINGGHY